MTPSTILDVGLHFGIKATAYHADPCPTPSLSSSVARTIIKRSLAHAFAEHPRLGASAGKESTDSMDTGSVVHALLAGTGRDEIELGNFDTFRSKAAKEWEAKARAMGKVPVLEKDLVDAEKIAEALRTKAAVGLTDNPFTGGHAEATAIWKRGDAYFRARYDRLFTPSDGPWTCWDWKVTGDVSVSEVKRKFRRFGYHLQAAHYLAGMDALCPKHAGRHSFVFAFVEDSPPYSVRRYCLKPDTLGVAAIDIRNAHLAWEEALKSNVWPDASRNETTLIDIPNFADDDEENDVLVT
jgi:hypothetical protein